jgi:DNA polymerase-1
MAGPLIVVDTPWLLYRSFFALPRSIVGSGGEPVGALLGTVNAMLTAVTACEPRAVTACFGRQDAPYRVELYPAYHAHRDPMPDALAEQWERAPALLARFGWQVLDTDELEADDLLYSLARTEEEAGGEALIMTADRDLFQAVGPNVSVLELTKEGQAVKIGPDEVKRRYGVEPELVPDFIALRGDPSDGLPGAKGIGPKTARDLLLEHGSLEQAIARSHRERPRVGEALRSQADELRDFRRIATLVRVPVKRPPDAATDYAGGAEAAREYGMRRLAARLERVTG